MKLEQLFTPSNWLAMSFTMAPTGMKHDHADDRWMISVSWEPCLIEQYMLPIHYVIKNPNFWILSTPVFHIKQQYNSIGTCIAVLV